MAGRGHKAPWRSLELTAYFESLMDRFVELGSNHLVFTPPTTRGSLITRCEAWAINTHRDYVPTLADLGKWPLVALGDHPDTLSNDQAIWLSRFWGDTASKWARAGSPGLMPASEVDAVEREQLAKKKYAGLVLQTFKDFEHADKRAFLERRSAVERAARGRL